ncbi:hypothetical protein V6N11_059253 [Hibiscus sabdariffa]|uniref:Uncharacterized protein n=1 Tax=Hibiscus sabdariffa TaxID=183260 RepID=A0ABR2U6R0_9ROSI
MNKKQKDQRKTWEEGEERKGEPKGEGKVEENEEGVATALEMKSGTTQRLRKNARACVELGTHIGRANEGNQLHRLTCGSMNMWLTWRRMCIKRGDRVQETELARIPSVEESSCDHSSQGGNSLHDVINKGATIGPSSPSF